MPFPEELPPHLRAVVGTPERRDVIITLVNAITDDTPMDLRVSAARELTRIFGVNAEVAILGGLLVGLASAYAESAEGAELIEAIRDQVRKAALR